MNGRTSKRARACNIPQRVRDIVWERDNGMCVLCGSRQSCLPSAHYISRKNGGLGVPENIVTLCNCINQNGAAKLAEILTYCAEIGLYKGNITLYALGAAFREFADADAIFYDGVCYWKYREARDISSWILRVYERIAHDKAYSDRFENKTAVFYDKTGLKERLEYVFELEPIRNEIHDTLGTTTVRICTWIVDNLRYPIAFLDKTLYKMISGSSKGKDTALYGETLLEYDEYFTTQRCEWIKTRLPYADSIARRAIMSTVGFDPNTTQHGMSELPKGHYAPVLYSTENYIEEMLRKPRVAV